MREKLMLSTPINAPGLPILVATDGRQFLYRRSMAPKTILMSVLLRLCVSLLILAPALVHAATLENPGNGLHYSGVSAWRYDNIRNEETTDRKNANCDTLEIL